MSESAPSPSRPSTVCRVPGAISLAMVFDLIRALPRPPVGGPGQYGRGMIRDALEILWDYHPRDVHEALLTIHMIVLSYHGIQAKIMSAAHQDDLEGIMRWGKHAMSMGRQAAALDRSFYAHRRAVEARGEVPEARPGWTYDLSALEAAWRQAPVLVRSEAEEEAAPVEVPAEWPEGELMEMAPELVAVAQAARDVAAAPEQPLSRPERRRMEKLQRKMAQRLASHLAAEARRSAA